MRSLAGSLSKFGNGACLGGKDQCQNHIASRMTP
jgi:hypothetical protein